MLTSNVQLGYVLTRGGGVGGGQAVQGSLSCPPPHLEFQREWIIRKFYYIIYYRRDAYFKGSVGLRRGGGQAVQCRLYCPPPRISERMDNPQILLHHLLQEYLVERDINIISVNLRCLLQMFSWVTYWQRVGGKLSRVVYLAPPPPPPPPPPRPPEFQRERIISNFYYIIYFRDI